MEATSIAALAVAALGLITTMLAPLLQARLAHRHDLDHRYRDLRVALCLDLARTLETARMCLRHTVDPWTCNDWSCLDDADLADITSRVTIVGSNYMVAALHVVRKSLDRVRGELEECSDHNDPERGHEYLPADHRSVAEAGYAVTLLLLTLRRAIRQLDDD